MYLELLDSLTLPGDPTKPNDDAFAHDGASAVVMDGATGLGEPLLEGDSDAAWVAHFGAERLMAHMRAGRTCEEGLRESLRETDAEFVRSRRRPPRESYENPVASMMFVSLTESRMHATWFGDCAALVRRPRESIEVLGDALAKRARERERVAWLAASFGATSAQIGVREVFLPALRRARNLVNTEAGGWLFGPDTRAADHAAKADVALAAGTIVMLVTDGFLALASDYDKYSVESLLDAAQSRGLEVLGDELRAIEESDPEGKRFPRFKKSDDATAMLLRATF
jgi:serine/threonine protein phosphatase PrpC